MTEMSVKGEIKEGAGFSKEEMNEHGKSPESRRKAQEGRDLRNEGRVEDGKTPKTTQSGTGSDLQVLGFVGWRGSRKAATPA
jgi:hypothetical protein